jgi:SsrA-binding protein
MKLITKNKRAFFEYTILDKYTAGIQLKGSEVKSIKLNNVNMNEAHCFIHDGEMFIKNMHVSEHKQGGTHNNHVPIRDRKLLLKKKEIFTLNEKVKQKGLTIVPLAILLSPTGYIKIEIGLAKGKNTYDKKLSLKLKTLEKELKKELD